MFFSPFLERKIEIFGLRDYWLLARNERSRLRSRTAIQISKFRGKSADKIDKLSRIYRPALNVGSGLIKRNAAARID